MNRLSKYIHLTVVASLVLSIGITACTKNSTSINYNNVDKTTLNHLIDSITTVLSNAVEGNKPGQYAEGAKEGLHASLDLALQVKAGKFTQAQVTAACGSLLIDAGTFSNQLLQEVSSENLIAHWLFNGNAKDSSGNGHTGILATNYTGASGAAADGNTLPQLTTDRFDRPNMAYLFTNGATIEVPYSLSLLPSSMTISLWVKIITPSGGNYIFSLNRWNTFKINIQGDNSAIFTFGNSAGKIVDNDSRPGTIATGTWAHFAITYTSGLLKFYINGQSTKDSITGVTGTPMPPTTTNLTIGNELPKSNYNTTDNTNANYYWGYDGFEGCIDDVRFYKTALSAGEILSIYTIEKSL